MREGKGQPPLGLESNRMSTPLGLAQYPPTREGDQTKDKNKTCKESQPKTLLGR